MVLGVGAARGLGLRWRPPGTSGQGWRSRAPVEYAVAAMPLVGSVMQFAVGGPHSACGGPQVQGRGAEGGRGEAWEQQLLSNYKKNAFYARVWLCRQGIERRNFLSVSRAIGARLFRSGTLLVVEWWWREPSRMCRGRRELPVLARASSSPGSMSTVAEEARGVATVVGEAFGSEGPTLGTEVRVGLGAHRWPMVLHSGQAGIVLLYGRTYVAKQW